MAMSTEHRSKFAALHRYGWKILEWDEITKVANKLTKLPSYVVIRTRNKPVKRYTRKHIDKGKSRGYIDQIHNWRMHQMDHTGLHVLFYGLWQCSSRWTLVNIDSIMVCRQDNCFYHAWMNYNIVSENNISDSLKVKSGVRHGCIFSPVYTILDGYTLNSVQTTRWLWFCWWLSQNIS